VGNSTNNDEGSVSLPEEEGNLFLAFMKIAASMQMIG
jgi:hypothetical protein